MGTAAEIPVACALNFDHVALANAPIGAEEFSSVDESLAWNAEGWEEFSAAR